MKIQSMQKAALAALLVFAGYGSASAQTPAAADAVIGSGTAASCQTNDAANAFTAAVQAGGTVSFNCGADQVIIEVNTSVVNNAVTVVGGGRIVLNGENLRQHFLVQSNGILTLNDITLIDGNSGGGGAIYIAANGQVTINNSFLTSNQVEGSGHGGAIYTQGQLTIVGSNLGSNQATGTGYGGAIYATASAVVTIRNSYLVSNRAQNGGAIYKDSSASLTVERTAFRTNIANASGGGIFIAGNNAQIVNATFSDNRADTGGGIYKSGDITVAYATFNENRADTGGAIHNAGGLTTLSNSIFAGSRNLADSASSLNCDGPSMGSGGRNIIGDGTCLPNPGASGDLFNTDPQLGVYQLSPTRGYIPAATSPAVDYGLACPAVDQRNFPRPLGAACDVGAIERGSLTYLPLIER